MLTLEMEGSQCFFTMDLIAGVDFKTYVRPGDKLNEARLRSALPQLVSGIIALHSQHQLHRDLKPGNVMVDDTGKVVVLDFGLVMEQSHRANETVSLQAGKFAGTPSYSAPEQFEGRTTPASDWYALGTMLYEALTGELPFRGSFAEVMTGKMQHDAPRLAAKTNLPPDLASLADQLLARAPEHRPDSLAIAGALSVDAESSPQRKPLDSTLLNKDKNADQILVGRESQLESLVDTFDATKNERRLRTLTVTGRSGEGKTSLVETFLNPLRLDQKAVVLSGRCYDRESLPRMVRSHSITSLLKK